MELSEILVVLYPGCIFYEIALVVEILSEKYTITYATPEGEDHRTSNGSIITGVKSYESIDPWGLRAIVIPGGDPGSIKDNLRIEQIIQEAHDRGVLIAAICAGPFVLAKAGVLKGKKIAHGYDEERLELLQAYFEGVTLTEMPVSCDENIITARPEAHIDFAVEISCRLGCVDSSKANRVKDYYKGLLGKKIHP